MSGTWREASASRSSLPILASLLFAYPFVTVKSVERRSAISNQGARNLIIHAVKRGWPTEVGSVGRGGRTYWVAHEVFDVIDAYLRYDLDPESPNPLRRR